MSARATGWLAWSLLALALLFGALGCLLFFLNDSSPSVDTWFTLAFLAFPIVGVVIASRRPENAIGWMFCVIGVANSLYFFAGEYAVYASATRPGALPGGMWTAWSQEWTAFVMWSLMFSSLLLFPAGRLPSPRWRLAAWTFALVFVLMTPLVFILAFAAPALVFARFWRAGGGERQQIKWFACAAAYFGGVAGIDTLNDHVLRDPVIEHATNILLEVAVASIPVAVGIAILRYRLYDIDVLINRTLVYGGLTASLAAAYFGGVAGFQRLLAPVVGDTSQLAVVASTLIIAALFTPLRRRIQGLIDRRFYRRKYDAANTLAAFSAKLRDETDLRSLDESLVKTVRNAIQPEHVSLWLKDPAADDGRRSPGHGPLSTPAGPGGGR